VDSKHQNWAGNVTFAAAEVARPTSVAELQDLVAHRRHVRALGSGHSFNRIADTDGTLISLDRIPGGIEVDSASRRAWVPAGATYARICPDLHAGGWALANLASVPHVTVAGACATGTHGSGRSNPGLAAAVSAVELVRPGGELETVTAADVDFSGSVVALGALGIALRVQLDVEPAYDVAQEVLLDVPLAAVLEHMETVLAAGDSVSLFTDWATPATIGQVWVKRRVPLGQPTADTASLCELVGGSPARSAVHPVPGADPTATTDQLGVPGAWYERLPHFRADAVPSAGAELQSEWLVPARAGAEAVERLAAIAPTLAPLVLVSEVRTVASDKLWLSPAWQRDSVALHFTWRPDGEAVARALPVVEETLAPFDPRPHWGKLAALDSDALQRAYPRLRDFADLADRVDPERVLSNAFVDRCLGRRGGPDN
jgi:xylitol oxidase